MDNTCSTTETGTYSKKKEISFTEIKGIIISSMLYTIALEHFNLFGPAKSWEGLADCQFLVILPC